MAKKVLFVIVIVLFLAMAVFFTTTGKAMVGVGEMPPGETSGNREVGRIVYQTGQEYSESEEYKKARDVYECLLDNRSDVDRYAVRSQECMALSNIALGDEAGAMAFLQKRFEDQILPEAAYSALKES